jgi:protein-tyrosine-phosphatase
MSPTVDEDLAIRAISDRLRSEYAGILSTETIERFIAESWEQLRPTARLEEFLPVLTERFARERLRAVAQAEGAIVSTMPEVLFVCVHNAGRSQMAAALLAWRGADRVHVRSAGSAPASDINPAVVAAMEEIGIDLSQEFPKPLTDEVVRAADVVVTMGCGDACPVHPGTRYLDWEVADPAGQPIDIVRDIRDEIDQRVQALVTELVGPGSVTA